MSIDLIHGDCLEKMKDIEDKSIDMILTDPPYGTTACSWDSVIPFEPMWKQLKRIIKDNGVIALFGSQPFTSALIMSNIKMFRYEWIWEKTLPINFVQANKMPLKKHENITIYYKRLPCYNPQFNKGDKYKVKRGNFQHVKNDISNHTTINNGFRFPVSVLNYSNSNNNSSHPTQKPVKLLEYLILTYTQKGETVLDFTMGSGSTGVACLETGRNFIGIELDDKYFAIAKERIEKKQREPRLFY
jgi:site-specific DNA-methyltransferase (adenine-specific)